MRGFRIRLLDEFHYLSVVITGALLILNISVACTGIGRLDSDSNQAVSFFCKLDCSLEHSLVLSLVLNEVVTWGNNHYAIAVLLHYLHRCISDTCCSISGCRLSQYVVFTDHTLGKLHSHLPVCHTRHDEYVLSLRYLLQSLGGIHNHRILTRQLQELLRSGFPAKRPESGSATARHYHSVCLHRRSPYNTRVTQIAAGNALFYFLAISIFSLNQS